jgi:hypothetical protein
MPVESSTGNQYVRSRSCSSSDRSRANSAINFEVNVISSTRVLDHCPDLANFGLHGGDVFLATKPRIDGHDQHEIDEVENMLDSRSWCGRVKRYRSGRAKVVDVSERAVKVHAGFHMNDQS